MDGDLDEIELRLPGAVGPRLLRLMVVLAAFDATPGCGIGGRYARLDRLGKIDVGTTWDSRKAPNGVHLFAVNCGSRTHYPGMAGLEKCYRHPDLFVYRSLIHQFVRRVRQGCVVRIERFPLLVLDS